MREALALHKDFAQKLSELERKVQSHDAELQAIIDALRQLMEPPKKPKREIGFRVKESPIKYRVKKKRK